MGSLSYIGKSNTPAGGRQAKSNCKKLNKLNQKHYLCSPKLFFNGKSFSNQERRSSKQKAK